MRRTVATFALILAMFPAPALLAAALSPDDLKVCLQGDEGDIIHACTALIETKRFAGSEILEIYMRRAAAFGQAGQFDAAIQDYNSALAISPNSVALLIQDFDKAIAPRRDNAVQGQADPAPADIDKTILLTPSNPLLFALRGAIHIRQRNYDAAIADFDAAIKLKPDYVEAYMNRGEIYQIQGQRDRAFADLDKAVALAPSNPNTLLIRGLAHVRLHEYDTAVADFGKVMELDPELPGAYAARAGVYGATGRIDEALQDEDKAVALAPGNSTMLNNRCFTLAEWNRKLDQAMADCTRALAISPNTPAFLDSLGLVYFRMGDLTHAAASYNAALVLFPKEGSSLFMRGIIKLKQGDASGSADIAAAEQLGGKVAETYAGAGIVPPAPQ